MQLEPSGPNQEAKRLHALQEYRILDTDFEAAYDNLTRLAAQLFDVPMAAISLVDLSRQWFKSSIGLDVRETPRDVAFCDHVVRSPSVLVVEDATQDPRFCNNPLVIGAPGVQFYAGAPLTNSDGHCVGTLCILDTQARQFDARQQAVLATLAQQVLAHLEQRKQAAHLAQANLELRRREERVAELQSKLENSENLFAQLTKQVPGMLYQFQSNPDGSSCFPYASESAQDVFEVSPEQIRLDASIVFSRMHPQDLDGVVQSIARSAQELSVWQHEYRVNLPRQGERWLGGFAQPQRLASGAVLWHGFIKDITDRKRMEISLAERQYFLSEAQRAGRIGVYETNLKTGVWKSTEVMDALFGIDQDYDHTIPGWTKFMHGDFSQRMNDYFYEVIRDRKRFDFEYQVARPSDGVVRWMHGLGEIQYDSDNTPAFLFGTVQDITDRKASEAQLAQATAQALAANKAKDQFLANMSHELRTPINGMLGMLRLLQHTAQSAQQIQYTERAESCAREMHGIVDNLLNFKNALDGQITLKPQPCHLRPMLNVIAGELKLDLADKGLRLDVVIDPDTPRTVMADTVQLHQVLLNLCSNAIKFTSQGEITLAVKLVGTTNTQARLEFSVQDTGIGIAAKDQKRIFEAFSQVDASNTRRYGGVGLGLTFSQRWVHLMGGDIQVESELGQGSRFYFSVELPVVAEQAVAPPESAPLPEADAKPLRGLRILLVEDNLTNQFLARMLLQGEGAWVTVADNGKLGVQAIADATEPFDVVLMDLQMPVMDGYEATRTIRHELGLSTLPIVALTANTSDQDLVACAAVGMNDHVGKPFDFDHLVAVLLHHSGRKRMAVSDPAAHVPPDLSSELDSGGALLRLGGNAALYSQTLKTFIADMTGLPAALEQHLSAGDHAEAARALHTLKGLAATIGARKLEQVARDLESRVQRGLLPSENISALDGLRESLDTTIEALEAFLQQDAARPSAADSGPSPVNNPAAYAAVLADLRGLQGWLDGDDMQSLEVYSRIRQMHSPVLDHAQGAAQSALLQALEVSMADLDFPGAAAHCADLIRALDDRASRGDTVTPSDRFSHNT